MYEGIQLKAMLKLQKVTIPAPLEKVFSLLKPNKRCPKIFIAGGAAYDFDKAEDVDLWFPDWSGTAANRFLDSLTGFEVKRFKFSSAYEEANSERFRLEGEFFYPAIGKNVQVLSCSRSAQLILLNFDLTVHQISLTAEGRLFTSSYFRRHEAGIGYIQAHEKTLERYIKLCKRYGVAISKSVLEDIKDSSRYAYTDKHGESMSQDQLDKLDATILAALK